MLSLDQDDEITDGKLRGVKSDAGTLMDGNGQNPEELLRELKKDAAKKKEEVRRSESSGINFTIFLTPSIQPPVRLALLVEGS